MYRQQRKLFTKEKFLEGNRQKWVVVFLAFMGLIMCLDAAHCLKDPTPYLTFLTFLAGAFILGYSGSETMKLFRASSESRDENIDDDRNINLNEHVLTNNAKENDYNIRDIEL
jgi:hypothetical protein